MNLNQAVKKYMGKWVNLDEGDVIHVMPETDIAPHANLPDTTIAREDCPCKPKVEGHVIIHNSFQDMLFLEDHYKNTFGWK